MKNMLSPRALPFLLATILSLAVSAFDSPELRAQCNTIAVTNNTDCSLTVCSNPPANPDCFTIPGDTTITIAPNQNNPIAGVRDFCGNFILFPNDGCIPLVKLGTGCCARVCFDRTNCTITATKVANGCDC